MAKVNPIRFSTQYTDDETDLVCYLHRYYNPSTGRWLSKDPLEELSFRTSYISSLPAQERYELARRMPDGNGYQFTRNDPVDIFDKLGLCPSGTCDKWTIQIVLVRSVFISGGGIDLRAKLIADKKCCIEPKERYYQYLGVGLGVGADWTINYKVGSKDFTTPCVAWKDHEGFGRVTGWGVGVVFTYGQLIITTPQTYLQIMSPSWGLDLGIFTTVGGWRLEE